MDVYQGDWEGDLSQPAHRHEHVSSQEQQPPRGMKPPKQLRFITHGAPPPKRRRVSTACQTCRRRKVACSGERPACNTCTNNKVDCTGYASENGTSNNSQQDTPTLKKDRSAEKREPSIDQLLKRNSDETNPGPALPNGKSPLGSSAPLAQVQFQRQVQPPQPRVTHGPFEESSPSLSSRCRNRMPYFRWLGPTSISPGFKQMVVKVHRASSVNDAVTSPSVTANGPGPSNPSTVAESDIRTSIPLPFYDNSSLPPSELITDLCVTFFKHLGCNFPFLQRDRFLKDLEEKQVDAILIDAVCALAARFSTHPMIVQNPTDGETSNPSEYGSAFAQRAKLALIDTFATPSVAAAQSALLIAYNEFGESRDSGLWMYLGISIRLAQDLGLQKLDGLRYEGRGGSTPRVMNGEQELKDSGADDPASEHLSNDLQVAEEQRAVERGRVDTFWAIFFLDRVVSSGTGRRSTMQDSDIELSFPSLKMLDPKTGWPSPFPALIRIICLYGHVTDLLNGIREPSDVTSESSQELAAMEARVTHFYQGLSPKLHFQALNFHHYVKAGEGTNFVLLHVWFHTLIILLHQPTLLKTFEGNMLQLFPNSQALAMSSAKTIADILSYSQLIDTKAGLGNPFTTQPIYIAACAFLKEAADQTATSKEHSRSQSFAASRASSPQIEPKEGGNDLANIPMLSRASSSLSNSNRPPMVERALARHTLLATAANQHYQLCYKALESIEKYWGGTKYIITVLDQRFKGVGDPLLYTAEEGESSLEQPQTKPAFTSPSWRRKFSWTPNTLNGLQNQFLQTKSSTHQPSPPAGDSNQPIGWTLTGTLDSPNTNVAWHFSNTHEEPTNTFTSFSLPSNIPNTPNAVAFSHPQPRSSSIVHLLPQPQTQFQRRHRASLPTLPHSSLSNPTTNNSPFAPSPDMQIQDSNAQSTMPNFDFADFTDEEPYGDLLIESQDVDMSALGLDMLPWFDTSGDFGI